MVTQYTADDLQMADQLIAEAKQHIVREEELIDELRMLGHSTREAEHRLVAFMEALQRHYGRRDAIAAALEIPPEGDW